MKYLFLLCITFTGIASFAQISLDAKSGDGHVKWKFHISKTDDKYTIDATAILEKGWHIFSANPGGDGSLTSTQIEVNEILKLKTPVETSEDGGWIEKELEGIGPVKYYEQQASFKISFAAPANIKTFTGNVAYQICNDKMCMAPTTKSFSLTVK